MKTTPHRQTARKSKIENRKSQPRYALRKGLGFWELTFAGRHAVLKHEQGLYFVACLLTQPPEQPIHGLALSLKADALYRPTRGETEISNPGTGQAITVSSDATLQERNLLVDDAAAVWSLRRKQLELEALLDDEDECEPVKSEALRELAEIYEHQKHDPGRARDAAQRAVRAVSMAIKRLHRHLTVAVDAQGRPHPVLRPFAAHLEQHLLIPSGRFAGSGRGRKQTGVAGCFTYEPPEAVAWAA